MESGCCFGSDGCMSMGRELPLKFPARRMRGKRTALRFMKMQASLSASSLTQKESEELQDNPSDDIKCLAPALRVKIPASSLIQKELEELQDNPSEDMKCLALASNLYEWQFAIKGPNGTEFEGGIYHGCIQLSKEYPDKPPIIKLLTENGRFQTKTRISFDDIFQGEQFGVRKALLKLIDLLPTYPNDASGSVGNDEDKRRALAIESRKAAPRYGTTERQKLIDEIHEYMLSKAPPVPSNGGGDTRLSSQNDRHKRKLDKRTFNIIGNIITSKNSKQTGVFGFDHTKKQLNLHSEKRRKTKTKESGPKASNS